MHESKAFAEPTARTGQAEQALPPDPSSAGFPSASESRAWVAAQAALAPPDAEVVAPDGRPVPQPHWGYERMKRWLDILVSVPALVLATPLLLATAALIRADSRGPILFRQQRVGHLGRPLLCWKFRTMVDGADSLLQRDARLRAEFDAAWKLRQDPRVTRVGRWLRKASIDELPQLVHVVRGEMSLVGPRPVQPAELKRQFGPWAPTVISVKPGLTGLWQVSGRSSVSYRERVALDVEYVRRRSIGYDIYLLLRTIPAVLGGKGAV